MPARSKDAFALVGWPALSFAPALIGSQFRPGAWYATLAKPAWTPPGALFAPVWTLLYALMGISAWLVWRRIGFRGATAALSLFVVAAISSRRGKTGAGIAREITHATSRGVPSRA